VLEIKLFILDTIEETDGVKLYNFESNSDVFAVAGVTVGAIVEGGLEGAVEGGLEGAVKGGLEGAVEGGIEGALEGVIEGALEGVIEGANAVVEGTNPIPVGENVYDGVGVE